MSQSQDRSNIEKFNYYLREFVGQLKSSFPELNTIFEEKYESLVKANPDLKTDLYLKHYITVAKSEAKKIATQDVSLFDKSIELFPSLDFSAIWKSKNMTDSSQKACWKYLEVLYVIGRTCVSDHQEIQNLIHNFRKGIEPNSVTSFINETEVMDRMIEDIRQKKIDNPTAFDDKDEDEEESSDSKMPGILGQLAGFDLSKMTDMIQNNPLMKEIMNDLQEEFKDESMGGDEGENGSEPGQTGESELNQMEKMLKQMESGDMASKIQSVMSKVTKKVHDNIKNGKINPQAMQENMMNAMGSMGINPADLASQLGNLTSGQKQGLNQMQQRGKLDARKDRMRRKLEENRKKKEEDQSK